MNTTIQDFIAEVRYSLADELGKRWSNNRLIDLLNRGLRDFVLATNIIEAEAFVLLVNGQQVYDVSDKLLKLTRVEFQNEPLPLKSHKEMDRDFGLNWQVRTSAESNPLVERIIYDKTNRGLFKIYPIQSEVNTIITSQDYGIITAIVVDIPVTIFYDIDDLPNDVVATEVLKIYYTVKPRKVTVTDLTGGTVEMETADMWDDALKYFVIGYALLDDKDAANDAKAKDYIALYNIAVESAAGDNSDGFTESSGNTGYYGGFGNG